MWKTVDIGSLCLETSQRDPQREPDTEFVYVDIASVDNYAKRINGIQKISGKNAPSRARKEIRSGDILVSTVRPNLNAVAFVPQQLDGEIASTGFCILRPNPELVDNRFLFYRTTSIEFVDYLSSRVTGANYPAVSDSVVKSAPIPLPSLPIQKQIVAILEKADAAREKRRQANQFTEQFLQSAFLEMFGDPVTNPKGWETIKLGKLADRIVVGHVGPTKHGYVDVGIPFLRTQNVRPMHINYEEMNFISDSFHKKLRKSVVHVHDVLISRVGVNRGMAAVVPTDLDGANCANIVVVGSTTKLDSWYLAQYLNYTFGKGASFGYSVGSAQGVVNTGNVKQWPMRVPPIALQQKFSALVKKVDSLRTKQKESEQELEKLFQSLMQRAFKGELVS